MLNLYFCRPVKKWRRVRVVEGARLESVYMGNCIKGSNPFVSALTNYKLEIINGFRFFYANNSQTIKSTSLIEWLPLQKYFFFKAIFIQPLLPPCRSQYLKYKLTIQDPLRLYIFQELFLTFQ